MVLLGFWFLRSLFFQNPDTRTEAACLFFLERREGRVHHQTWVECLLPAQRFLFAEFNQVVWESFPFHPIPISSKTQQSVGLHFYSTFLYTCILLFICLCICPCWILSDIATKSFQACLCLVSFHSSFGLTLLNIFATRRYFWSEYTAMTLCFQWQCSVLAAMSRHKMPCKTASWFKKKSDYIMLYHSFWLKFQESSNRDFVLPTLNSKHV